VYCAVAPPLMDRLDMVTFGDEQSAISAVWSLLETIDNVHRLGLVLLNVTAKTIFISGVPIVEPPSQPVFIDDPQTGLFTLPRGMILPKLRRMLEAGGQYHKSLDFYMALRAFHDHAVVSAVVRDKLKRCMELFTADKSVVGRKKYSTVDLSAIRAILGPSQSQSNGAIKYTTTKSKYKLLSVQPQSQEDHDEEDEFELIDNSDCTAPVYDHVLDMFRRQTNSAMDYVAP